LLILNRCFFIRKLFDPKRISAAVIVKDINLILISFIKKEPFPRIFLYAKKINDGSDISDILHLQKRKRPYKFIRNIFRCAHASLSTTQNIERKKFKVCLGISPGNAKARAKHASGKIIIRADAVRQMLKENLSPVFRI